NGQPRRAAVDAFGIGGLNVHVVLEDFPASTPERLGERRLSDPPWESAPTAHQPNNRGRAPERAARAIIGLGALFPGARNLDAFRDLLSSGKDPKCEVPRGRWQANIYHEPGATGPWRSPTRLGGFIADFVYDWKKHRIP